MRPLTHFAPSILSPIMRQIDACDDLWNLYGFRNVTHNSPHADVDDIWLRANAPNYIDPFNPKKFLETHNPVWYSAADRIDVRQLCGMVIEHTLGHDVGGVLITRIPAGKGVGWHRDGGWNQQHYDTKVAVMLQSNREQAFCFEQEAMVTEPGDAFCFWNEYPHCVVNDSDEDRMTLIFSIRTRASTCRTESQLAP